MKCSRFPARPAFAAALALLLAWPAPARAGYHGMLAAGWEPLMREAIFRVADSRFEEGLAIIQRYIDAYPDDPAGYFFYAAGVQEKFQKRRDESELPRFFRYAEKCQSLAEERLRRDPDDTVARVYLGAADGYTGLVHARQRNLLRAFKNGVETKTRLEQARLENPEILDSWFGLGMLYYYASRKREEEGGLTGWVIEKFITGGKDMRLEAAAMIRRAYEGEALSSDYARAALMWIALFEGRYAEAEALALATSARFTNDLLSRWTLGRVALAQGRCVEAEEWFGKVDAMITRQALPRGEYRDVEMALNLARACHALATDRLADARRSNDEVRKWLAGDPKITLEYQDEKRLLAAWRKETGEMERRITALFKSGEIAAGR